MVYFFCSWESVSSSIAPVRSEYYTTPSPSSKFWQVSQRLQQFHLQPKFIVSWHAVCLYVGCMIAMDRHSRNTYFFSLFIHNAHIILNFQILTNTINSSPWCSYGRTFKKLSFLPFVYTQRPYHSEFPNLHQYDGSSPFVCKEPPKFLFSVFWGCSPPRRCHRNFWNAEEGPHQAVNRAFPDLRISFLKEKEENESDIRPFHTFGRSSFRPIWIFSPSIMYRNHSWDSSSNLSLPPPFSFCLGFHFNQHGFLALILATHLTMVWVYMGGIKTIQVKEKKKAGTGGLCPIVAGTHQLNWNKKNWYSTVVNWWSTPQFPCPVLSKNASLVFGSGSTHK